MITVKKKKGRGRPIAFDRDAALNRAMTVFWARGYDHATMPILTEEMGISAQSLYAAFGTKEALYREALDRYRETIGGFTARALAEESDVLDALGRLFREAALIFSRDPAAPGCMITTAPAGIGDEDPLITLGRRLRAEGEAAVADRLRRAKAEGQILPTVDCSAWARYVTSIIQGLSVQARDTATYDDLLTIADIAAASLSALRP